MRKGDIVRISKGSVYEVDGIPVMDKCWCKYFKENKEEGIPQISNGKYIWFINFCPSCGKKILGMIN